MAPALLESALLARTPPCSRLMMESDRVFTRDVIVDDRTRVERAVADSGRALEERSEQPLQVSEEALGARCKKSLPAECGTLITNRA